MPPKGGTWTPEQREKITAARVRPIPTEKRCAACRQVKPAEDFGWRSGGRWLKSDCKPCHAAKRMVRYRQDPSKSARAFRRWLLKSRYGMTEAAFEAELLWQGGRCAICPATEASVSQSALHVDHDHKTGAVRALLCSRCNIGIGCFADDPSRLAVARDYLLYHGTGPAR